MYNCFMRLVKLLKIITLGAIIERLRADINDNSDKPLKKDVVLIWTADSKRIITGADLLGRLLKGI